MNNYKIRNAKVEDLSSIMKIEQAGFSTEEASSKTSMKERIQVLSNSFFVATHDDKIIGFIVGTSSNQRYIDDDLYEKSYPNKSEDNYMMVLSIAVDPDYKRKKIGSKLLNYFIQNTSHKTKIISLTCLERLIPFYEKNGFINEGPSDSSHANELWFNMIKEP